MYCRNCGKQIIKGSRFCQNCGQEIDAANEKEINENAKPSPETPKSQDTKKTIEPPSSVNAPPLPEMTGKKQTNKKANAAEQNTQRLPKKSAPDKKKKHGFRKFIKIIIFSLLSVPVLVLLILLAITISKTRFQDTNIQNDAASNNNESQYIKLTEEEIEAMSDSTSNSRFIGVWKLTENRTNPDNISKGINIYDYDPDREIYAVIMDDYKIFNVSYDADGNQISNVALDYSTGADDIIGGAGSEKLPENAYLKLTIGPDDELIVCMFQNDKAATDFSVYTKTLIDPNESSFPIQSDDAALATPETTMANTEAATPNITPEPTQQNGTNMKEYTSPVYETEIPLYTVLTNGTWVLSGIADNPDKIGGEEGEYTLEALNGYMLSFIFEEDNTLTMIEENQGESIKIDLQYEIMDIHYCDTYAFADGTGYRFYLGSDGLLYMCEYEGDESHSDFSDFYVLQPLAS